MEYVDYNLNFLFTLDNACMFWGSLVLSSNSLAMLDQAIYLMYFLFQFNGIFSVLVFIIFSMQNQIFDSMLIDREHGLNHCD